ncbi:hypothetical protein [Anaerorhabdus sp.]|uniref:hypothetical protein n=1 Tax=Anaerorhabdus sp. TaxID=1872524 RepID=UPI002FCABDF9
MKKLCLLLLILTLAGCNTINKSTDSNETEETINYVLSDKQNEQLDLLLRTGGYFDDVIESSNNIFYKVENDIVSVQLNGKNKINVEFKVNEVPSYTYDFIDIDYDYQEESDKKSATLYSIYTRTSEENDAQIESALTTSDEITYQIIFNQDKYTIENNKPSGKNDLPESLQSQVFDTYVNQWNEVTLFDSNMQMLSKQITDIFMNFDSYTYRNHDSAEVKIDTTEDDIKVEKPKVTNEFTDFPSVTNFRDTFYWYSFNGETMKSIDTIDSFDRTLSLFFFLTSRDSFSIDELAGAFMRVDSEYYCYNNKCSMDKKDITTDTFRNGEFSLMTLDYFNQCIKDVFGFEAYSLEKYSRLDNGIIISQSEQTLVGDDYSGDWQLGYNGAVVDHVSESNIDTVTFTPYTVQISNCPRPNDSSCTYDIYTPQEDFVVSNIPSGKVNDYVVNHMSKFITWEIKMTPRNNSDFYQVLSYKQLN